MKTPSADEVQVYSSGRREMVALERTLRVGELMLRMAVLGFGLAAAALVGSDSQVRMIFSFEKKAKFTDMKVLVFLVVVNAVVAGYSLVQGLYCLVRTVKGSVVLEKGLALIVFVCDQVMAYLTLSAVAAAAESGLLAQFGQSEFQWMKVCNFYKNFCTRIGEGLAFSFLASMIMISLSGISAFSLFRLYGNSKSTESRNGTII